MGFMYRKTIFHSCLTVLLLISNVSSVAAEQLHKFGSYRVVISPDMSNSLSLHAYQIIVEQDNFLLTRLLAQSPGTLSSAYVVDLDSDASFEVLVTFALGEREHAVVHFYDWLEGQLVTRKLPELSEDQSKGYKGNDEFAIKDNKFLRIYQIYEEVESSWVPTKLKRHLELSHSGWEWIDY